MTNAPIRIWLDDQRPAPPGWLWLQKVDEAIKMLQIHEVAEVSLDFDMDFTDPGRYGVEVLAWVYDNQEAVRGNPRFHLHSANPYGSAFMALWLNALEGGPRPTPDLLREALVPAQK